MDRHARVIQYMIQQMVANKQSLAIPFDTFMDRFTSCWRTHKSAKFYTSDNDYNHALYHYYQGFVDERYLDSAAIARRKADREMEAEQREQELRRRTQDAHDKAMREIDLRIRSAMLINYKTPLKTRAQLFGLADLRGYARLLTDDEKISFHELYKTEWERRNATLLAQQQARRQADVQAREAERLRQLEIARQNEVARKQAETQRVVLDLKSPFSTYVDNEINYNTK